MTSFIILTLRVAQADPVKETEIGRECGTPSMSRLSRKCGNLNTSQPYGPPRPVTGIPLLVKAPTHLSHRDGGSGHGGDKVFSYQQRGGSDQFEKSCKHSLLSPQPSSVQIFPQYLVLNHPESMFLRNVRDQVSLPLT
jgi:hypothetical protein